MIISYDGATVRSLALEQEVAAARFGDPAASWLHALLTEIEAAEAAAEVIALYNDAVSIDGDSFSIDFGPGILARFRVVRERTSHDAAGLPVWPNVRRLKLTGVEADGRSG